MQGYGSCIVSRLFGNIMVIIAGWSALHSMITLRLVSGLWYGLRRMALWDDLAFLAEFHRANHVGRPWNRHGIVSDGSQVS
jgi:hypothetical protein